MKKRAVVSLVLALILGLSSMSAVVLAEDTVKIGGIGVLSGPYAVVWPFKRVLTCTLKS